MSSLQLTADGFAFAFKDALNGFVFDEIDKAKTTFHGAPMKAVDLVVEFDEYYLFVEIKDHHDINAFDITQSSDDEELTKKRDAFRWLKNYLKYKFRDSLLYRFAEGKTDKPVKYVCLLANMENALCNHMLKELKKELPTGRASKRWSRELASSCAVVNLDKWNSNFTDWPAQRTPEQYRRRPHDIHGASECEG